MKHKHCRKCGEMIVKGKYDIEVADLSKNDNMVFHKDVCYNNGFCSHCVLEYGIERLVKWFYRGDKI